MGHSHSQFHDQGPHDPLEAPPRNGGWATVLWELEQLRAIARVNGSHWHLRSRTYRIVHMVNLPWAISTFSGFRRQSVPQSSEIAQRPSLSHPYVI